MKRQSTFVLAQLASDGDPTVNFEKAKRAVAEANEKYKPDLMVFPECFMSYFSDHPPREVSLATSIWMAPLSPVCVSWPGSTGTGSSLA
mgnify:CR=1 FL=1